LASAASDSISLLSVQTLEVSSSASGDDTVPESELSGTEVGTEVGAEVVGLGLLLSGIHVLSNIHFFAF
jgi:hypothetical protein